MTSYTCSSVTEFTPVRFTSTFAGRYMKQSKGLMDS